MIFPQRLVLSLFLFTFLYPQLVFSYRGDADFQGLCEKVRREMISKNATLDSEPNFECRRTYTPSKDPALRIEISVPECLARNPGFEKTKLSVLSQWVGPLAGFLLPALAFVILIPRPIRIPRKEEWFGLSKLKSVPWLLVALLLTALDIVFWIIAVFAFAGPLVAGSIHEAVIDQAVLNHAENVRNTNSEAATRAIAFSLVGSLKPHEGDLQRKVSEYILNSPYRQKKLLALLGLLPAYGTRVGIPIVFYLGAYAYALFEANSKLGDNDTAHAVAFGLWYGVVVIVATVSRSVLGIDNPASLEAIFSENRLPPRGHSRSYHYHDSSFMTIWVWNRARGFQYWTRNNTQATSIQRKVHANTPRILSGLLASCLVSVPCVGACWISYSTPEVGFGCRSTTHLIYGASQIILIMGWWIYYSSPYRVQQKHAITFSSVLIYSLAGIALAAALLSSIGGTIMHLVGVYRNCICRYGLRYLLPGDSGGMVLLSNDMQEHRDHAKWWIIVGSIGIAYIGVVGVVGWLYQARIRSRCKMLLQGF